MKMLLCIIFFLLVSCSTEKAEQELNPIEKEYLEKRKTFSAAYCFVYGSSVIKLNPKVLYECCTTKNLFRNSHTKRLFVVADSSAYKSAFSLSFPLEEDTNSVKALYLYSRPNLLIDCFNRDSTYLGSITVNDHCKTSNSNGRMDKRMLEELKSILPEWYASYEKQCKL